MERIIENKTFDEIRPGETITLLRNLAATDLRAWSVLLGDEELMIATHTQALAAPKEIPRQSEAYHAG